MDIKKLNEELKYILEEDEYNTGNTTKDRLKSIKPGVYINRGQSEVCHEYYPNHWQYFGPYLQPINYLDMENLKQGNGETKEIEIKDDDKTTPVLVIGELVKSWEEFEYEDDNIHHWYYEEYKILEVK